MNYYLAGDATNENLTFFHRRKRRRFLKLFPNLQLPLRLFITFQQKSCFAGQLFKTREETF